MAVTRSINSSSGYRYDARPFPEPEPGRQALRVCESYMRKIGKQAEANAGIAGFLARNKRAASMIVSRRSQYRRRKQVGSS